MAYRISDECIKCGCCAAACPVQCISEGDEKYIIDESKCISCATCASVCPVGAPKNLDE
jgi:ferredoxin